MLPIGDRQAPSEPINQAMGKHEDCDSRTN